MKTRKLFLTALAMMCAVAFQVNAQNPNVEKLLKNIEQKVKLADKHPKDGKMQLNAACALTDDSLGEKRDFDRALTYANRALKIAQEQPSPKDTLLALTCTELGLIYMAKQDMQKSMDYIEMSLDAYEVELGRLDPVTNGNKLVYGWMMAAVQPSRGFSKVVEAINDNARAPQDKRIQNMDEANFSLEMALELLLAEQYQRFRHALPSIVIDGKRYIILQTGFWNMERPIVGWIAKGLVPSDTKNNTTGDDDTILYGEDGTFRVLTEADEDKRQLLFNVEYVNNNRNFLKLNDGEARLMFLNDEAYNQVLTKFHDFKASKK